MAQFPALPLWTDAHLADTTHLTTIQQGAYLLLLMCMWRNKGTLPNDDKLLARYAGLTAGQWKRLKPAIWPFFKVSGGSISQGRLTDELNYVRQRSATASNNAKARWLKPIEKLDAGAMPEQCSGNAPTPTATATKEERTTSVVPKKTIKKASRLPEDWKLPADYGNWALEEFKGKITKTEIIDQSYRFADYWIGKAGKDATKTDWFATWRNWIRGAIDQKPGSTSRQRFTAAQAAGDLHAKILDAERGTNDGAGSFTIGGVRTAQLSGPGERKPRDQGLPDSD